MAAALLVVIAARPAYAYIDPGTGSLIYQTALSLLLGLAFVLRRSRASVSRFLKRLGGRDIAPDGGADSRD